MPLSNRKGVIELSYRYTDELYHHGIKGQKWGVRRFQNKDGSLTPAGKERYYVDNDSGTAITKNSDGSYTVPTGFKFNRVGQQTLDVNKSGVLYVSYGKEDAARYVKSLGPTLISRLMGGNGQAVQHIEAKKPLRMASEAEVYKGFAEVAAKNRKILDRVNDDDISRAIVGYGKDWSTKVTKADAEYAVNNPNSFAAKRMGQAVSFWMGDSRYAAEASILYKHFKDKGYDAIPDITDRDGGGFDTSMIIINTDKITMTSSTKITRDIMKDAKSFVKTLAEKPYEDIYQDIDAIDAYKEKHPNTKMTDSEIGKMLGY